MLATYLEMTLIMAGYHHENHTIQKKENSSSVVQLRLYITSIPLNAEQASPVFFFEGGTAEAGGTFKSEPESETEAAYFSRPRTAAIQNFHFTSLPQSTC